MDGGLLIQIVVVVGVLVGCWVLLSWDTYHQRAQRLGRWVGVVAPEPVTPPGPPVERIAADAVRIRTALRRAAPGTPVARMRGWLDAYDDALVAGCRALGLQQRLDVLARGPERDLERERVERMLVRAGLLPRQSAER